MDKEEWQSLYDTLYKIHRDFLLAYSDYKNGKNKTIRLKGQRKAENAIDLADRYIRQNFEFYALLTGENNSDYGRAIVYGEFKRLSYFGNDMSEFLIKIKEKIKSYEE